MKNPIALFILTFAAIFSAMAEPAAGVKTFDIPAQSAAGGIAAFAKQADIQFLISANDAHARRTNEIRGSYSISEALAQLLMGTGLTAEPTGPSTYTIVRSNTATGAAVSPAAQGVQMRLARVAGLPEQTTRNSTEREVHEVVVTGSHIRGGNSASPLLTFGRDEIERSGFASTAQFMQALPQNFGGGQTDSIARAPSANGSVSAGTSLNLRGLGTGTTLTLLNGYRLAPTGFGDFVDISLIPLPAVERIDVLMDGASAIYGTDAIGGVVNFILRDDYSGAHTSARYGTVTAGDSAEYQVSQMFGTTWRGGNALASYEYYRREPLKALDRDYAATAPQPYFLLPDQKRHSVFTTASQRFGERLEAFGNGFFTHRDFVSDTSSNGGSAQVHAEGYVEQFGGVAGMRWELARAWQSDIAMSYSKSANTYRNQSVSTGIVVSDSKRFSTLKTIDLKADGVVFALRGGEARLGLGAQYRDESYLTMGSRNRGDRDIKAAFAEVYLPLFARLSVTGAIRYEEYSDFGDTANPKFGILWTPVAGLNLRGTYGTSFKAPYFDQLNDYNNLAVISPSAHPQGGTRPLFQLTGMNARLQPEEATSWTVGFDLTPAALPRLKVQATYFDIEFTERIGNAYSSSAAVWAEGLAGYAGPYFIANPSVAFLQGVIESTPRFLDRVGLPLSQITGFADLRVHNLAGVDMNGVDVQASYSFVRERGRFGLSLNGQYLLGDDRRTTPTAPVNEALNKPFNSVDLRLRGGASWNRGRWGANLFIAYLDNYRDTRFAQPVPISSLTTADLTLTYDVGDEAGTIFGGTQLSLTVLNATDKDPPYLNDPVNRLNFDGANASPVGRFVAIQATKSW